MWTNYLEDTFFISKIFKKVPDLIDIELFNIDVNIGADRITILININTFVDYPPKKWGNPNIYNLKLSIDFFTITNLTLNMDSLPIDYKCSIKLEKHTDDKFKVIIYDENDIILEFSYECGIIQSIKSKF